MIGIDTNVLVRLLTADPAQARDSGMGCEYTAAFDQAMGELKGVELLKSW